MKAQPNQEVARKLSGMNRHSLVRMLRGLHCSFELDFTDDLLDEMSLERLRHIVMAALLHSDNAA